jgi:hypothetical protein
MGFVEAFTRPGPVIDLTTDDVDDEDSALFRMGEGIGFTIDEAKGFFEATGD